MHDASANVRVLRPPPPPLRPAHADAADALFVAPAGRIPGTTSCAGASFVAAHEASIIGLRECRSVLAKPIRADSTCLRAQGAVSCALRDDRQRLSYRNHQRAD